MGLILQILSSIEKDNFINKILDDFLRTIWLRALQIKIKPYTSVSLKFLASELRVEENEIKTLLVELILEGKVQGKID